MPKLLILSQSHLGRGGVESGLAAICRGLPDHGWDVCLGLTKGRRFHDPESFLREHSSLRFDTVECLTGTREGRIGAIIDCIERQAPDVVLSTRVPDAYVAVAQLKRAGRTLRLGGNIRGCVPQQVADVVLLGGFIDFAVGASELLRRTLVELSGLASDRIFAFPSGVDVPGPRVPGARRGFPLKIAYVGRLDDHDKRVMMLPGLVAALRAHDVPVEVHIVGDGSPFYSSAAALRRALGSFAGDVTVAWHGWLGGQALRETVLRDADCCISFSPREGAPIAIREAMAHGVVPVMAAFLGCHSEGLYRHGENCLLFPVDAVDDAAGAILSLHRDRDRLGRLSRAAATSIGTAQTALGLLPRWAEALDRVLSLPPRAAEGLPPALVRSRGRLERIGLPPTVSEWLRQQLRTVDVEAPSDEWPGDLGAASATLIATVESTFAAIERRADPSAGGPSLQAVTG
jgi:glycosyltransferase involved in cell wall biosynthesis